MKLVYDKTQQPVAIGDQVTIRNEETPVYVTHIQRPYHGGSTGRVYISARHPDDAEYDGKLDVGYYPSVIGATWIEREDRIDLKL